MASFISAGRVCQEGVEEEAVVMVVAQEAVYNGGRCCLRLEEWGDGEDGWRDGRRFMYLSKDPRRSGERG